ncbi:MAG: SEC-C metal-binding domain-containing protein [Gemmataceae bacterium]
MEKLGRNDPCPCGSGHRFQTPLHAPGRVGRLRQALLFSEPEALRSDGGSPLVCAPLPNRSLDRTFDPANRLLPQAAVRVKCR